MSPADLLFMLVSAALVMIMTPGLALFYGGLVGKRNAISIMMQTMVSLGWVSILWVLFGFSLVFGPTNTVFGWIYGSGKYFFLNNINFNTLLGQETLVFMVYQMMVAVITPVLIVGAFPGRFKFSSFMVFLTMWFFLVYVPIAHMIWGEGIFQQWGVLDFSGGIVVHASAGFSALASALYIGKRKFNHKAPHNIPLVVLGIGLLWVGWYGFNSGSALGINSIAILSFINTTISASFASITWMFLDLYFRKKVSSVGFMTGVLAGLVVITPSAGYVSIQTAMVIGIIGAIVSYFAIMLKNKMGWDDTLDVWGVHGMDGFTGILLLGIFATIGASGLILGNYIFFLKEFAAVAILSLYSFIITLIVLYIIDKAMKVRVSLNEEMAGQDKIEFDEEAYLE
ncbi:MAG: ammonium transporter [Thermoplasmata archaeon]|nr:ammonium transporter [Thermoplasmata archaeon]